MLISVIIVSWNSCSDLKECLDSLRAQTFQGFEIILIDNHSEDHSTQMVKNDYPEVVLREMQSNLGFAEGCNRGIEVAKGDWICTLNSDAVAMPEWLATMSSAFEQADHRDGMFQSKVLFKENLKRINSTGIVLLATGSSGDRDFKAPLTNNNEVEEIFVPSASAAAYRMEMLLEAKLESGFFDRSFFMYAEDFDLGWRCRLMGWKAYYLPKAEVHHGYQGSSRKWGDNFADLQCRKNRIRVLFKNASMFFLTMTLPKTIYDLVIGFWHSGPAIFVEFYKAMRDGFLQRKNIAQILQVSRRDIEKKWVIQAIRIRSQKN